jgi:predicted Zn-dependent protease
LYLSKETDKALEYIDVVIALKTPNPCQWVIKSQILASQRKYEEALHLAKEAIVTSKTYF